MYLNLNQYYSLLVEDIQNWNMCQGHNAVKNDENVDECEILLRKNLLDDGHVHKADYDSREPSPACHHPRRVLYIDMF